MPANAGEAEILPMISRVSQEDVTAVEGAPGAARVEGIEEAESIGRRALRKDMLAVVFYELVSIL